MNRREFARLTSFAALALPCKNGLRGRVCIDHFKNNEDIKKQSIAAFKRFESVWNFNDFWKRGNTFDACLTFADAMHRKWPRDAEVMSMHKRIGEMLEENYQYFTSLDPGTLWADDFGWWGLMGINARKHLLRSGNTALADKYATLSIHLCWQQERDHAYDFSDTALPVSHGCSNGDANGKSKGVKNTVTNVLFFLLSTRIYRLALEENIGDKGKYLEMAYRQWVWFDSWFKLEKYGYLQKLPSGGGLVQERPTAFFEGSDYKDTTHPTWENGWVWSGDQGMLLAALIDLSAIKNDLTSWVSKNKIDPGFKVDEFEKTVSQYISLLGKGIKAALTGNSDDIIREAPFNANFGPEFGNDYLAGRGIMMRYLGQADKQINSIDFVKNIRATASAIWQTRDTLTNQVKQEFTCLKNDKLYVDQYRKLTGTADDVYKWQIETMNEKQKLGVCQSIGLDAFGAVINSL
ncbi:MAG: hypothetical protein ABI288_07790 [Ginsengibacter sp.]